MADNNIQIDNIAELDSMVETRNSDTLLECLLFLS